jgi:hypothetical protein
MDENPIIHRIIEALRTRDGVIITFENGKYATYPASLLYSMLPKAVEMSGGLSAAISEASHQNDHSEETNASGL